MTDVLWRCLIDGEREVIIAAPTRSQARKIALRDHADEFISPPKRVKSKPNKETA